MNFALGVIIKTTILLALASLMTLGLRRASASARHTLWFVALLAALLLPPASRLLPQLPLPVLPEETFTVASPQLSVGKDNITEQRGATPSSQKTSVAAPLATVQQTSTANNWNCLLYTSDAADE